MLSSLTAYRSTGIPTAPLCRRLRSLFVDAGVQVKAVYKDVRHSSWGYVTFASLQQAAMGDEALEAQAAAQETDSAGDAVPGAEAGDEAGEEKKKKKKRFKRRAHSWQRKPAVDPATIRMADIVCPLREQPYGQQLLTKQQKVVDALQRITEKVRGRAKNVGASVDWLPAALESEGKLCCPLLGVVRSPQRDGYRNKCEFTVANDVEGRPTVGFLLGAFKDGYYQVGEPLGCVHLPPASLQLAAWAQEYMREHSELPVWDKRSNQGFWRLFTVREGRNQTWLPLPGQATSQTPVFGSLDWRHWLVDTRPRELQEGAGDAAQGAGDSGGQHPAAEARLHVSEVDALTETTAPMCDELLVLVQVNDKYTTPEQTAAECSALGRFLLRKAQQASPQLPIRALLLQYHSGLSNAAQPDAEVFQLISTDESAEAGAGDGAAQGLLVPHETYIHDSLCELTFRVSSGAFFQVNNGAAAVLYQVAGDWAAASGRALLLDVCCGTGTIGLTLARRVREVVGIELVEQAIEDAKVNAQDNSITNCTWVCGKAEDVLREVLDRLPAIGEAQGGDASAAGASAAAAADAAAVGAAEGGDEEAQRYRTQFRDFSEVVAIVDPPRAGLHPKVLKALLRCEQLKRIVYVSCNPESLAANCIELCSPPQPGDYQSTTFRRMQKEAGGGADLVPWLPFKPVKAVAVDLFPHTKHCEAVMLLER